MVETTHRHQMTTNINGCNHHKNNNDNNHYHTLATLTTPIVVLANNNRLKLATIVNDMSEINIAGTLANQGLFNGIDEELIELSMVVFVDSVDGAIKLQKHKMQFDYVSFELTIVLELSPVAPIFDLDERLNDVEKLDTVVTVAYCETILITLMQHKF